MAVLLTCIMACTPPPTVTDADGDGWDDDIDCDPHDPRVHPGHEDPWGDGEDANCDGVDGVDADGDGWAADLDAPRPDCDDGSSVANPGVFWDPPFDDIDTDCDGSDSMHSMEADLLVAMRTDNTDFGESIAVADVDGDGLDDLFVGAPRSDGWQGRVYGFRGADLSASKAMDAEDAWWVLEPEPGYPGAGWTVDLSGDADADGVPDLTVLAYDDWPGAESVYVVTGARLNETPQMELSEADAVVRANQETGWDHPVAAWAGDFRGTGKSVLAIGGQFSPETAGVMLFWGERLEGAAEFEEADSDVFVRGVPDPPTATNLGEGRYGWPFAAISDLNGDGRDELLLADLPQGRVCGLLGGLNTGTTMDSLDADFGFESGYYGGPGRFGADLRMLDASLTNGRRLVALGAPDQFHPQRPDAPGGSVVVLDLDEIDAHSWQQIREVGRRFELPAGFEDVGAEPGIYDLDGDGNWELGFSIAGKVEWENRGYALVDPAPLLAEDPGTTFEADPLGVLRSGRARFRGGHYDFNGDGLRDTLLYEFNGTQDFDAALGIIFGPAKD